MAYGGIHSAPYSIHELDRLMSKAKTHARNGQLTSCDYFLRDKTEEYFRNIMEDINGVMVPYEKDEHGDPRCPVSKRINGLFFSSEDGMNSIMSFYGRRRLRIKSTALICRDTRAYFADFYCVPGRGTRPHYVTIVLTTPGTHADRMCRSCLVQLDLENNPFIRRNMDSGFMGFVSRSVTDIEVLKGHRLHLEVLYTDNMNIRQMEVLGHATLMDIALCSHGSDIRNPRHKSTDCQICNLSPKVESSLESILETMSLRY